jgi:hypothetical protein
MTGIWQANDKANVAKNRAEYVVWRTQKVIGKMYKQQLKMINDQANLMFQIMNEKV